MWCDRILGNVSVGVPAGSAWAGREIDLLDVPWQECRQVVKKRSRGGREIRVVLPAGHRVRHGDVLGEDGAAVIVVDVPPCDVVVVRPPAASAAARLALELGNLHWPTEVTDAEIVFPEDGPAMKAVEALGLSYTIENRRFTPTPLTASVEVPVSAGFKVVRAPAHPQAGDVGLR